MPGYEFHPWEAFEMQNDERVVYTQDEHLRRVLAPLIGNAPCAQDTSLFTYMLGTAGVVAT